MKKFFILCMLLTSMMSVGIHAQGYSLEIIGDFESKCLLPNEGTMYIEEFPQMLVACEGSIVKYDAITHTNGDAVQSWTWYVEGGTLSGNGYDRVEVTWGGAGPGLLMVTITTDAGYSYSHCRQVTIVENPIAGAISVPRYDNSHVIRVCRGMDVEFIDSSSAPNSNIIGYHWDSCGRVFTSRNLTMRNVTSDFTLKHGVINSCGCYDEESFYIKVLDGSPLEISCYGTACEGSTVSYHATSPSCSDYTWIIEGGTLVNGQGSTDFSVAWSHPHEGYGVISLDGNICGNNACEGNLSIKVPIISDSVEIIGRTSICEGEAVIYSVPLYGSTRYTWSISNSNDVDEIRYNDANKIMYAFPSQGTYRINVEYQCDFLNCGPFHSKTLVVDVKPKLEIVGEEEVCLTNNAKYTTVSGVQCTWTVYELYSNNPVYTSPMPESLFETAGNITAPGDYKITASDPAYCNVAEFVVFVKSPPLAPTSSDMDANNPVVSCPHSGIRLRGQTNNPDQYFIWSTTCNPTSAASGDDVTLFYENDVCDVEVYTYDRLLRCRSEDSYIHQVTEFNLLPVHLPTTDVTVCPGTLIKWTADTVEYQPEVIYKWELEDNKQYCATIEGRKDTNAISLRINNFMQPFSTQTFELYLHRTYCSGTTNTTTVRFHITDNSADAISIDSPEHICQGTPTLLQGVGCTGQYRWNIERSSHTYTENPLQYTFHQHGYYHVTMSCNPYTYCNNRDYYPTVTTSVYVTPKPPVTRLVYDGTNVHTVPPLSNNDYSFFWHRDTNVNNDTAPGIPNQSHYTCTITSLTPPYCSSTASTSTGVVGGTPCSQLTLVQRRAFDYCNKTISFNVVGATSDIVWDVSGHECGPLSYSGQYNDTVTIPVNNAGNYTVIASITGQPCYRGYASFAVDFLPNFALENHCTYITIVNKSTYTDTNKFMTLSVNNTTMGTYRVNKDTINYYTGNGGTFDFKLTGYDLQTFSIPCNIGSETITNSAGSNVTITTANTYNQSTTCTNTPIELTAAIAPPHTVVSTHWEFGDNNTFLDTVGVSVYHTFEDRSTAYKIKVTVIDENGCESKDSIDITSETNPLEKASIDIASDEYPICQGVPLNIEYQANGSPVSSTAYYDWTGTGAFNQPSIYTVYNTNSYKVSAINDNYCSAKANKYVSFFNLPTANITPKKYNHCVGETIELHGEPGDQASYTYDWTIYNTTTQAQETNNDPYAGTLKFPAGSQGCNYIIDLIVKDAHGCKSSAATQTLLVSGPFAAPNINFGNPRCIHESSVNLVSDKSTTQWSNTNIGYNAYYYYPGVAMAWYYDYLSGCRSDTVTLRIPEAPDFDALLTGCYKICEQDAYKQLPVYGLLPYWQDFDWYWHINNLCIDQGTSNNGQNLLLPLAGLGYYHMKVKYFDGCDVDSRQLVIKQADRCKCDGLDIDCQINSCYDKNCRLMYDLAVTVCNHSGRTRCLKRLIPLYDTLAGNINITSSTFAPVTLTANNCTTFYLTLSVARLMPTTAAFKIIDDDCDDCEADFSIDLTPDVACTTDSTAYVFTPHPSLSGGGIYYYDFSRVLYGVTEVLAVWSAPASVINYNYNTSTGILTGLCAFNLGEGANGSDACLYILVCTTDGFCVRRYCQYVPTYRQEPRDKRGSGTRQETADAPQLKPNPATGMVGVVSDDEVTEVLVMDMKGRQMAAFSNTTSFNVANLATGTYIVRIKSRHGANATERITYLKLVKQ